jgi:hypothetical protein
MQTILIAVHIAKLTDFYVNRQTKIFLTKITRARGIKYSKELQNRPAQIVTCITVFRKENTLKSCCDQKSWKNVALGNVLRSMNEIKLDVGDFKIL